MDKIYVVTTVHILKPTRQWNKAKQQYKYSASRKRVVGWFPKLEDAIWVVASNERDIHEAGHYNHCVIEEIQQGLYPGIDKEENKETWFKWVKGLYLPTYRPDGLEYSNCIG